MDLNLLCTFMGTHLPILTSVKWMLAYLDHSRYNDRATGNYLYTLNSKYNPIWLKAILNWCIPHTQIEMLQLAFKLFINNPNY